MIEEYFVTPIYQKQLDLDCSKIHKFCMKYSEKYPSDHRSNRGGYHSDTITKYAKSVRVLNDLSNSIFAGMQEIHKKYKLKSKEFHITNMWFNINHPGNYNVMHNHPGSFFSGAFYIDVPQNSGELVFKPPTGAESFYFGGDYNNYFVRTVHIKPKRNLLVLFPSWIDHYVEQNNSDLDRISISFNTRID